MGVVMGVVMGVAWPFVGWDVFTWDSGIWEREGGAGELGSAREHGQGTVPSPQAPPQL